MKNILYAFAILPFIVFAQPDNLASNGSFEAVTKKPTALGLIYEAMGMSSANGTTVDLFSKDACNSMVKVPTNYMGVHDPSSGSNYAGIVAFYGDETAFDKPGYQNYTEYLQVELTEPLIAGQTYDVALKVALADKSAYALSGLGVILSKDKFAIGNNSYLFVEPDMVYMNILKNSGWSTIEGTYRAEGGEKYLIFGTFADYVVIEQVIPNDVNNSRKAYYYVDDISIVKDTTNSDVKNEESFSGGCFKLKNLNFEPDKAIIVPESFPELNALADFLKNYPNLSVYIDGYTDKTDTNNINIRLSADRANAVKSYLISKGVNSDNLVTRWYGSEYPIDERYTNNITNRRVEIVACCFK